jgi:uncharacterized membrane protein
MTKLMKASLRTLAAVLCMGAGAYPFVYLFGYARMGLLQTKSDALLSNGWWRLAFQAHIVSGGIALSIGWSQFMKSWRTRHPGVHRAVGKVYLLTVCLSGTAAICIAPQTTTGWIAGLGFGSLGLVWLYTSIMAYRSVRQGNLRRHRQLMIYSYSACFAAVTLRLWLPLLLGVFRLDFDLAYPLVAWLCWIPNLIVAHTIASRA